MFRHEMLVKEMNGLRKFARRLTKNKADAEDLLQASILRAIEKKHLFQPGTDLFKWTCKIMYNQFVSDYRRKVKFESQYDPAPYIEKQTATVNQEKALELKEVDEALQNLSTEHAEILIFICVNGMKYKEAAIKLGIPVGTVRSRLSRAREQMQAQLEKPQAERQAKKKYAGTSEESHTFDQYQYQQCYQRRERIHAS